MCGTKMSLFLIVHTKWVQTIFRNKNFEEKISVPYQFSYLFKSKNVFCPWNTYSVLNSTKKRPILLKVQFVKIGNTEKWRLFIKTQCEKTRNSLSQKISWNHLFVFSNFFRYVVKTLLSRNFCQKSNFVHMYIHFHTMKRILL